jgi:hypothetical protein
MSMYLPNDDVHSTGAEAAEFAESDAEARPDAETDVAEKARELEHDDQDREEGSEPA